MDTNTNNNIQSESGDVWIIDTDYSFDDQVALPFLLNKLNVIAITVVGANCQTHPAIIKRKIEEDLATKWNKEVKVYAGADRPYINYQKELKDDPVFDSYNVKVTDYSGCKEEGSGADINQKISNIAAVKIAEFGRLYAERLHILTLGPLTNLSLAVLIDVNLRDTATVFVAGGSYNNLGNSGNAAEYNFRADPVAAKNVISYYKKTTIIPLELEDQIIQKVNLKAFHSEKAEYRTILELWDSLAQNIEESRSRYSFLGLLAALVVVDSSLVSIKTVRPVDVDIVGRFTRGALAIEKYPDLKSGKFKDITIMEEIDLEKFNTAFSNII